MGRDKWTLVFQGRERCVLGLFGWKSIISTLLIHPKHFWGGRGGSCRYLSMCLSPPCIVPSTAVHHATMLPPRCITHHGNLVTLPVRKPAA